MPGRNMTVSECLGLLALSSAILHGSVLAAASAFGRPRDWPLWCRAAVAIFAAASAAGWLWIDLPIEGATLWEVSVTHGVTASDLLAVPAALVALALVPFSSVRAAVAGRR